MAVIRICDICGTSINKPDYHVVKLGYVDKDYSSGNNTMVKELCDDCTEAIINCISELSITNYISELGGKDGKKTTN